MLQTISAEINGDQFGARNAKPFFTFYVQALKKYKFFKLKNTWQQ